jgi:IS1 family transposase
VGKHTDAFIEQLVINTEGKTACKQFNTDDWGGYERVLPTEVQHYIGKDRTQRLERTNGIVRQQTGRWHRRQNKFGKVWEQTKVTTRLVVTYFNWIWQHSRCKTTAATGRINTATVEVARYCYLSHTNLMHYRTIQQHTETTSVTLSAEDIIVL